MKVVRLLTLITFILVLSIVTNFIPNSKIEAVDRAIVYISSPTGAYYGDTFVVKVGVSGLNNMQAYQIQLNFDSSVITVNDVESGENGVTEGLIGTTTIGVDVWSYFPSGRPGSTIRIGGRVNNSLIVSGSGYLAEIHFKVIGPVGTTSALTPTESRRFSNRLFDEKGNKISTVDPWSGSSVQILTPVPLQIVTSELPRGVAGGTYHTGLTATGGYHPYKWSATGLPTGLVISESGNLSGKIAKAGDFTFNITVSDDKSPPNVSSKELVLRNCPVGDANEDGIVNKADVYKVIRIYLGLESRTPASDANNDGVVNMADVVKIQKIFKSP
jgi:hypothetical protein